jgi:hypothetical protein
LLGEAMRKILLAGGTSFISKYIDKHLKELKV